MGQIVAAMVSCHAPALFLRQPGEDPAQLDATIAAMRRLGRVLDETQPDALIVVGLDHLEAFSLDVSPAFAVVVGPEVVGSFGSKQYRLGVHQTLARAILDGCLKRDFDMAFCHKAFMGHAFVVPFEYVLEERQIPIVPLFVNVYVPPLPQPHRAYQLGRAIAEVIAERGERIAILASGGMSHYPGTEKYGHPDFDFDQYLLQVIERGELSSLLSLSSEKLDEAGETELLTWYTVFGAIGNTRGQVLSYQPTWHHGLGVIDFPLAMPLEGPPPVGPLPKAIEHFVRRLPLLQISRAGVLQSQSTALRSADEGGRAAALRPEHGWDVHRVSAAHGREGCREDPRSPESRQSRRTSNTCLDRRSPRGGRHARSGAEKWIEQTRL